jgi:hypothetical protein
LLTFQPVKMSLICSDLDEREELEPLAELVRVVVATALERMAGAA